MTEDPQQDYCSFTKAIEYLGDRWCLLILGELVLVGPRGFNALATGIPGHISRSILADRLRALEGLGLIARGPGTTGRGSLYRATPAGMQLKPVLLGLWSWSERWVPEDPGLAQRDPDLLAWRLSQRIVTDAVPPDSVVIDLSITGERTSRSWLVIRRGEEPSMCLEDPLLDASRYVYVEADADDLLPVAGGTRTWREAITARCVRVYGEPGLTRSLPDWFLGAPPAASVASPALT